MNDGYFIDLGDTSAVSSFEFRVGTQSVTFSEGKFTFTNKPKVMRVNGSLIIFAGKKVGSKTPDTESVSEVPENGI